MHTSTPIEELTAEQVARWLGLDGDLALTRTRIGTGQVAHCFRLELANKFGTAKRVVAKGPSSDETSRSTAALQRLYLRETSFYRELAPLLTTPTPACFHVEYGDDDSFLLLLDDLSPAQSVDQFDGLTLAQAEHGIDALASLHGPTRHLTHLFDAPWLRGASQALAPVHAVVLPAFFEQFLERYGALLDSDTDEIVRALGARISDFSGYHSPYECVVHGDFRTDNLLFDAGGGTVPLAVVDWQTVAVASPFLDVAYFLTTSLSDRDVVRYEEQLLARYLERMASYGVDVDPVIARQEFARYTLQPVVMLVAAAVIVERTDRGDRMFLEMIRRGAASARRWNALGELDRHVAT